MINLLRLLYIITYSIIKVYTLIQSISYKNEIVIVVKMEPAINQTSPTRPKLTNIETSSKEDPTFLTQNRQAKLVDSTIPNSEAINSLYKDLNNCILVTET